MVSSRPQLEYRVGRLFDERFGLAVGSVPFLVRDDEAQFQKARKLIARETSAGRQVFVGLLVLLETEWVPRSRYNLGTDEIVAFVAGLLDSADVQIEDEPAVEEALFVWNDHATGFADCLIGVRNGRLGCAATATFDAKASRLPGFIAA